MNDPRKPVKSPALYFVAVVPDVPVCSQVEAFRQDLFQRFGTKVALKSPPHITLLPPFHFERSRENELQEAVRNAQKDLSPFEVELHDFDSFPRGVLFVAVKPQPQLEQLWEKVNAAFAEIPGFKAKHVHEKFHPHMTIGNRDWNEGGFAQARAEYAGKKFHAAFVVKEISLLRLENGRWLVD